MTACGVCKGPASGWAYRPPGRRPDLPERLRDRYLPVCADRACHDAARARAAKAIGLDAPQNGAERAAGAKSARAHVETPETQDAAVQGDLGL